MPFTDAILIAGASSGVGKTTFTTGLIAVLREKGRKVQPFKAGPDYLDPTYHSLAAGPDYPARNLDTWMLPEDNLRELFWRAANRADFALIEGVMGLFDGKNGQSEQGSSASLAKLLGVPVIAVIDIGKMSRTAGAIALGLQKFDTQLNLAGFLLNNAGSERHYDWSRQAVEETTGLPVLGWLPKNKVWALPERHLGLLPANESMQSDQLETVLAKLVEQISQTVDIAAIERIAATAKLNKDNAKQSTELFPLPSQKSQKVRIGIAQDTAFNFYYQDSLDLLQAWGVELVPFSPLSDESLPPNITGLYIGGGFPEVLAVQLAANHAMRTAIQQFAENGGRIYVECGGLMYLGRELVDFDGTIYPMVGLLPYTTAMQQQRVSIGYVEVAAMQSQHPLLRMGEKMRGHEFHWSLLKGSVSPEHAAYIIEAQSNRAEGWLSENILASYVHLHLGSDSRLAPRLKKWLGKAETKPE